VAVPITKRAANVQLVTSIPSKSANYYQKHSSYLHLALLNGSLAMAAKIATTVYTLIVVVILVCQMLGVVYANSFKYYLVHPRPVEIATLE
jgi:hypothetical protein